MTILKEPWEKEFWDLINAYIKYQQEESLYNLKSFIEEQVKKAYIKGHNRGALEAAKDIGRELKISVGFSEDINKILAARQYDEDYRASK